MAIKPKRLFKNKVYCEKWRIIELISGVSEKFQNKWKDNFSLGHSR